MDDLDAHVQREREQIAARQTYEEARRREQEEVKQRCSILVRDFVQRMRAAGIPPKKLYEIERVSTRTLFGRPRSALVSTWSGSAGQSANPNVPRAGVVAIVMGFAITTDAKLTSIASNSPESAIMEEGTKLEGGDLALALAIGTSGGRGVCEAVWQRRWCLTAWVRCSPFVPLDTCSMTDVATVGNQGPPHMGEPSHWAKRARTWRLAAS